MKHEQKHYEIKNVVLLLATNAQKPCNKKEDAKLYKLWVAAKKDILREVLEVAYTPAATNNQDVFDFCDVKDATPKIQHFLRNYAYENPEEYVTFEIISWNKPFECADVRDFNDLVMQEFTITCDLTFKSTTARDEDGQPKINSKGQYIKTDAGCFSATSYFNITDLDEDLTFGE